MIVLLVQGQAALPALIEPLPCDDLHVPTDRVFVLLSRWRGRNQVRYGLGQVAVVFRAVLLDGILDVFSLLGCPLSTVQSLLAETCIHTIIKARQANLQAVESGQAVLLFECFHIHITPFHPFCAHGLQPSREQHTNVLAALCDIAVLVAARIPNDEMRYVRGQIELDGRAHLRANRAELCLHSALALSSRCVFECVFEWEGNVRAARGVSRCSRGWRRPGASGLFLSSVS
jgi:hypothetical protein